MSTEARMARLKAPQNVIEGEFKLVDGTEGAMVEESDTLRAEESPPAEVAVESVGGTTREYESNKGPQESDIPSMGEDTPTQEIAWPFGKRP